MKRRVFILAPIVIGLLCILVIEVQTAKAAVIYDLNDDGVVDMKDIERVVAAFNSYSGEPGWDPALDLDGNGKVNVRDIALIAGQFGQKLEPEFVVPELPLGPILGIVGCFTALGVFGFIKTSRRNWHFSMR